MKAFYVFEISNWLYCLPLLEDVQYVKLEEKRSILFEAHLTAVISVEDGCFFLADHFLKIWNVVPEWETLSGGVFFGGEFEWRVKYAPATWIHRNAGNITDSAAEQCFNPPVDIPKYVCKYKWQASQIGSQDFLIICHEIRLAIPKNVEDAFFFCGG